MIRTAAKFVNIIHNTHLILRFNHTQIMITKELIVIQAEQAEITITTEKIMIMERMIIKVISVLEGVKVPIMPL
jgi:hypothetical protein